MNDIIKQFEEAGQGHVFAYFNSLTEEEKASLLDQASIIDLSEIQRLSQELSSGSKTDELDLSDLKPAPYISLGSEEDQWSKAEQAGEDALKKGSVAAFTVAGGQGTRLGYNGPKGTYPVTPVSKKTLFQVFAEKLLYTQKRYGNTVHWFIMTSHINNDATVEHFEKNHFFGLKKEQVHFFAQGLMPAFSPEGKILLATKSSIAMSPDGHGGALRALVKSGSTKFMKENGIECISYFQVDNPLVRCIDPEFIGFHILGNSDMSSKMVAKAYPEEKVGHFCELGGVQTVIEYSDMPMELQKQTDSNGELLYKAGSIAIHIISREFIDRVGSSNEEAYRLPFHKAHKKIPTVDADGNEFKPEKENGIKMEMFVFDALPLAKNPVIIETARADDFSPVKNAEGKDSPETCIKDQLIQHGKWMKAVGTDLISDEEGVPMTRFEISSTFATTEKHFVEEWNKLSEKQVVQEGTIIS